MIELVPFTKNDFADLRKWIDNEELMYSWAGSLFQYPLSDKSLDWYIENSNISQQSDAFIFKVIDSSNGISIGHISLGGVSWKNNAARITRVLVGNPDYKGKGYCAKMLSAIIDFGFSELKMHRLSLGVYTQNNGAIQCYRKAGLKEEGIQRDVFLHGGTYWSMMEMSILRPEWEALKKLSS